MLRYASFENFLLVYALQLLTAGKNAKQASLLRVELLLEYAFLLILIAKFRSLEHVFFWPK